ncbi:MAG: hypothetical protein HAW63_03990 [Bdellovibrionaceae bacterium]|nr:hypothetical protein [Pseudobdellovibrionaceae bacterium]
MFTNKSVWQIIKACGLSRQKAFIICHTLLFVSLGCSHFQEKNGNKQGAFVKVSKAFSSAGNKVSKWGVKSYGAAYNKVCIYTKAAFDVGSGSTKMKVAKVDVCKNKILKVFLNIHTQVSYKANLVPLGSNFILNKKIRRKGFFVLRQFVNRAKKFKPTKFVGVGTAAFRDAVNAKFFFKRIKKELNIDLKIISQEKEAQLGFFSAQTILSKLKPSLVQNKKIIVWDIGGGSMQIISKEKRKAFNFFLKKWLLYKGNLASSSFKNHIIKKIQKNIYKKSPNPISSAVVKKAVRYAFQQAKKTIPKSLQIAFKEKSLVLGIGGVHYFSILGQVKKIFKNKKSNYYTQYEVQKTLQSRKHLSDKKIKGKHASTDISNLALVLGFMKYLDINTVYTNKVNLTDGILLNL